MHDLTFRKTGGFLNTPTPGGVPVRNTSPGVNVTNLAEEEKTQSGGQDSGKRKKMLNITMTCC